MNTYSCSNVTYRLFTEIGKTCKVLIKVSFKIKIFTH